MEYPYLAYKKVDDEKTVVIMFTSENTGVVVHTETDGPMYKFGKNGEFNEDEFSFYPENQYVRLQN